MSSSKKFKLTVFNIGFLLVLTIVAYFIWWSLPVSINRHSDIKFGNELISKIEQYRKQHGLPKSNDWQTQLQLGFKDKGDFLVPEYEKLNDTAYQLVYIEGFDGPYLHWNSYEKLWKKDMLTYFVSHTEEEDIVSLIEQTDLYRDNSKLIDSLSSGHAVLKMTITLSDTAKRIYLVKVSGNIGSKLVTSLSFLVDANKMTVLNPSGKLEGGE